MDSNGEFALFTVAHDHFAHTPGAVVQLSMFRSAAG